MVGGRAVHGLVRIGFGVNLQPTQLDWVYEKWTRNRPNIRIGPDISGHRLSGLKLSGDFGSKEQHRRNQPQTQRTHLTCRNHNPKQEKSNNTKNTIDPNLSFKSNRTKNTKPKSKTQIKYQKHY